MTSNNKLFLKYIFLLFFTNIIEADVNIPYVYETVLHCTEERVKPSDENTLETDKQK